MKITIAILFGILVGVLLAGQINQVVSPLFAETNSPVIAKYDPTGQKMYWETVIFKGIGGKVQRSWVPGGWLVLFLADGLTFYPDPEHKWQPWVKDYHGEVSVGYFNCFQEAKYLWIDQELKAEMTGRK